MDVVALVPDRDHVSTRYRILQFAEHLHQIGLHLTIEPIERAPAARLRQILRRRLDKIVLVQRKLLPVWQTMLLRQSAGALVYDFDDAVFLRDTFHRRGPRSWTRKVRFQAMVRSSDLVLAGNRYLADHACRCARAVKVEVIPTCIDTRLYRPATHSDRRPTRLVWIGSSSTLRSLESGRPVLEQIGRSVAQTRLKVICDRFPDFEHLSVERARWSTDRESQELHESDIGISWLADDLWSRGKCGLKILQYMAAGLPVVASPVGVHTEILGNSGFLPDSPKAWTMTIDRLARDPVLRDQLGREGRARIERRFDVAAWGPTFAGLVKQTAGRS